MNHLVVFVDDVEWSFEFDVVCPMLHESKWFWYVCVKESCLLLLLEARLWRTHALCLPCEVLDVQLILKVPHFEESGEVEGVDHVLQCHEHVCEEEEHDADESNDSGEGHDDSFRLVSEKNQYREEDDDEENARPIG
jgi:hypothetical protein